MINTRIYNILKQLDKPFLNRFLKFIDSPYHNRNQKVTSLAQLLINNIKSPEKLPGKQEIWEIIFESNTYDDLKFRKLCNDVLERFEKFLITEQLDENNLLKSNLLLNALKSNNIEEIIEKHISRSSRQFERELDQSSEFYLQKYQYERTLQNLKTNYEKKANIKSYLNNYRYLDLSQNLDSFYVIEKLRHATDILTWRKMYKTDIEIDLGFTLELIKLYNLDDHPAVKIYLYMYQILSGDGDIDTYFEFKEISFKYIDVFPDEERREIMDVLFNFCVKQINSGDKSFYIELLELYDWGIDSEIILTNSILSPTSFRNYVISGLRIGEFDRVQKFILEKSDFLEESRRENAINFNMARVCFYKKQFDDVLNYLNKVNYDDIWYNLNSKNYLLAVYYELGEDMVLESQMDS
ncbi:MAG: hypothetical protein HKN67_12540, partial [Saprospiraceae bacterium]|nr:hypothetical protein [Saprospiraceae bacterium]